MRKAGLVRMTPQQWEHVCCLFEQVTDLPVEQRAAFINGLQHEPAPVRVELAALLQEHDEEATSLSQIDVGALAADLVARPTVRQPPETVGPYRIDRELGRGGMGVVYLAHRDDGQFEQQVALKLVRRSIDNDEVHSRFLLERQVLARLQHPHIARLLDGGISEDGFAYFAMEYVNGESLVDYCRQHNLSVRQRLVIFGHICEAVQFAHNRLIVHRDIKPQNILVDQGGQPRLLDFGIAKILDDADRQVTTRTGVNLMTLQYASPEQVSGQLVTVASDIYQLGLLLFEMLAEQPPFDVKGMGLQQVIETICRTSLPSPGRFREKLSSDLDAIVGFALRKDPAERYRTVNAFARDVERYLQGQPVSARAHSRWYVMRRFVARNATLVGVVSASVLALAGAVLVSMNLAHRARTEAQRSVAVQEVLSEFFQRADPFGDGGADVSLADAVAQGRSMIDARIADDPALSAAMYAKLGEIQTSLGLYEQALEISQAAHAAVLKSGETDATMRFEILDQVARNLVLTGNPKDAIAFLDEYLPASPPSAKDAGAWVLAKLEAARAWKLLLDVPMLQETLRIADAAVERYQVDDPLIEMELHNRHSVLARELGDIAGGEQRVREMLEISRTLQRPEDVAVALHDLGMQLGRQRRYEEAEPLFVESIALVDEISPNHPRQGFHMNNYGGLLYRVGRHEEAVEWVRRGLLVLQDGPNRFWEYAANRDLAMYGFSVADIEEVILANRRQVDLAEAIFGDQERQHAVAVIVLARLAALGYHYEFALALHQRVVELHPVLSGVDMAPQVATAYMDMGDMIRAERAYAQTESLNSPPALELRMQLDCARQDPEAVRAALASLDREVPATSVVARRLRVRAAIIEAALSSGQLSDAQRTFDQVQETYFQHRAFLSYLDRSRLLDALVAVASHARITLSEPLAEEVQSMLRRRDRARVLVQREHGALMQEMGVDGVILAAPGRVGALQPEVLCATAGAST